MTKIHQHRCGCDYEFDCEKEHAMKGRKFDLTPAMIKTLCPNKAAHQFTR